LSSNEDYSARKRHTGLAELRQTLNILKAKKAKLRGRITLLVLQNDGLTTNSLGFARFFQPYSSLDVHIRVQYYGGAVEHPLSSYLAAISDCRAGKSTTSFPHSLIRIWLGISINKETYVYQVEGF
jgi:hypothetical protein